MSYSQILQEVGAFVSQCASRQAQDPGMGRCHLSETGEASFLCQLPTWSFFIWTVFDGSWTWHSSESAVGSCAFTLGLIL